MALFLFLGLSAFVLFNTGQTATDKARIVNTADSAAYSGLLWQARAMNFTAYTNRAMVANQVAMGQAVSLNSWSAYLAKTGENLNDWFGWIPYVGAVTNVVDQVATIIDTVLDPVTQGMMTVLNLLNKGLGFAQEGVYLMAFIATPDVVNSVVKTNDTKSQNLRWETVFSLGSTALNMYDWSNLSQKYDTDHDLAMNERFHIINASKDMFTKERDWRFFDDFLPVTPLNWFRFEKRGTTKFTRKNGEYQWYGKDAHSLRWKNYTWRGKKYRDAPISGGSSYASSAGGPLDGEPRYFGGRHKRAQDKDWTLFHKGARQLSGYDGIQAYRSIHEDWRSDEDPPTLTLRIEVTMDAMDVKDSHDAADMESNRFAANVATSDNLITSVDSGQISSVATGELFFEKPCYQANCETEFANGYSPFWDVRLAHTDGLARLAAYAMQLPGSSQSVDNTLGNKLAELPNYNEELATPISDYKAQAKGVRIAIRGMENHLASLASNPEAYIEYESRLNGIKDNLNDQVDDLIDELTEDLIPTEAELVETIVSAAGYELNASEFASVEDAIAQFFPELNGIRFDNFNSLDDVQNLFENQIDELKDELIADLEAQLKEEVEDLLAEAIKMILENMVSGYLADYGIDVNDVEAVSDALTDKVINGLDSSAQKEGDITFDPTNECSIYEGVHGAEEEGAVLREKLEVMNQEIANEFSIILEEETAFAVGEQIRIGGEIQAIRDEITEEQTNPTMTSEAFETWRLGKDQEIGALEIELGGVPEDRVHALATQLVELTNQKLLEHLGTTDDYELGYSFARNTVIEMLGGYGNIDNMELDENGDPITDGLLFSTEEPETASDAEGGMRDRPEGCPE